MRTSLTHIDRDDEDGFSLVEVMVAVLILGIIGAVVLTSVVQAMQRTASATNRTNALTDIERGLERISRQIRTADPLVIDPDGQCDALSTANCVDRVLTRRMDAFTFSDGEQVSYSYYLVDVGTDVELRQDVTRVDIATGTTTATANGEFIAEIANLDPAVGQPLFRFMGVDATTGEVATIDCLNDPASAADDLTVDQCRTAYATASVVEITLMKVLTDGEPLRVSTLVNIRNTRYQS